MIDRFTDSTIAYQHYGFGVDLKLINLINSHLLKNFKVDYTFLNIVNYKNMINLPANADCKEEKSSAKVINEGSHSEFLSQYLLSCEKISTIKSIEVKYFDSFQFSKELNVNLIAKNKKMTRTINKEDNIINVDGYFN